MLYLLRTGVKIIKNAKIPRPILSATVNKLWNGKKSPLIFWSSLLFHIFTI
jgi:hypothetical protein